MSKPREKITDPIEKLRAWDPIEKLRAWFEDYYRELGFEIKVPRPNCTREELLRQEAAGSYLFYNPFTEIRKFKHFLKNGPSLPYDKIVWDFQNFGYWFWTEISGPTPRTNTSFRELSQGKLSRGITLISLVEHAIIRRVTAKREPDTFLGSPNFYCFVRTPLANAQYIAVSETTGNIVACLYSDKRTLIVGGRTVKILVPEGCSWDKQQKPAGEKKSEIVATSAVESRPPVTSALALPDKPAKPDLLEDRRVFMENFLRGFGLSVEVPKPLCSEETFKTLTARGFQLYYNPITYMEQLETFLKAAGYSDCWIVTNKAERYKITMPSTARSYWFWIEAGEKCPHLKATFTALYNIMRLSNLPEYFIFALAYELETGKLPDVETWTWLKNLFNVYENNRNCGALSAGKNSGGKINISFGTKEDLETSFSCGGGRQVFVI